MSTATESALSYSIIRSERNTADIVVERDGSLVVRAPHHLGDAEVRDIVRSKMYWIYKAQAEWKELNQARIVREYRNGESFLYLGRSYRLSLVDGQNQDLVLRDGRFQLRRDLLAPEDLSSVRAAFRNFYTHRGLIRLSDRVEYFAPKVGLKPGSVFVRELGNRWGSCSPSGWIAIHWKSMMAPPRIIDYVIVHELAHLHQRHHTEAFWNEIDKVLPDYRDRREWLRRNGASLDV